MWPISLLLMLCGWARGKPGICVVRCGCFLHRVEQVVPKLGLQLCALESAVLSSRRRFLGCF